MLADITATGAVVADVPGESRQTIPFFTQVCNAETLSGTRTLSGSVFAIPMAGIAKATVLIIRGLDGASVDALITTPAGTSTVRFTEVFYLQTSAGVSAVSLSGSGTAQYLLAGN